LAVKKSTKRVVTTGRKVSAAVGLDVSDRKSAMVALDDNGVVVDRQEVATRSADLDRWAAAIEPTLMVIEAGPHSPWMSRLLAQHGHEVVVANPAKIPSISRSRSKTDWRDAEHLARLGRFDRKMLHEIRHRDEQTQKDLQLIRSRDVVVRGRSRLISYVRGAVKAQGARIGNCSTDAFVKRTRDTLPAEILETVEAVLETIDSLGAAIHKYDRQIELLARTRYPETKWLMQIKGVGALTALAYMLVLCDASRFRSSRMVGPYLGLTPARDQSGEIDPQKGISKEGDRLMRRLLVQSAHYILGPFGDDCDLQRHGLAIAARGGKNAKKRAAVAVARKLAVLLHHLWVTRETYVPLMNNKTAEAA
jgi:transposase